MSWDQLKKAKEQSGGDLFISLKDGDSIEGVFRGEPYVFYKKFKDPTDKKEYEAWENGRSFNFRINFLEIKDGTFTPRIFTGGARARDPLAAVKEEYGLNCVFKIKRSGLNESTRYDILFKRALDDGQMRQINDFPLKHLTKQTKEVGKYEETHEPVMPIEVSDDIPF